MSGAGSIAGLFARRMLPGPRDFAFGLAASLAAYPLLRPDPLMLPVVFAAAAMTSYSLRLMLRVVAIWWRLRAYGRRARRGVDALRGQLEG